MEAYLAQFRGDKKWRRVTLRETFTTRTINVPAGTLGWVIDHWYGGPLVSFDGYEQVVGLSHAELDYGAHRRERA
jgi:hypothetical protein